MSTLRLAFITFPLLAGLALATSACGVPLAVSGASYAADGGLLAETHKTSTDHLISMVSKQDCALWRVIKGRKVCQERVGTADPYKVDYNDPQRTVSEDGVQYTPPLRPAADAPATSWDAAAYRPETAPAPTPGPAPARPAEPTTAVAEVPEPAPATATAAPPAKAATAAPAKPAKAKARSVRKPSPRPAPAAS